MSDNVDIRFWDVRHGHATYIESPNGRDVVVDLGTGSYQDFKKDFSPLEHIQNRYNVRSVDYLVITHPHTDHIDDIMNFDDVSPRVLRRPRYLDRQDIIDGDENREQKRKKEEYINIDNRYTGRVKGKNKISPSNYGGLDISTYSYTECSTSNINNHSVVVVLDYEGIKVVIPGDNENCSLNGLMGNNKFKREIKNSDLLLAPHHGREKGYNSDFVSQVNPRITVVSDGAYGNTSYTSAYSSQSRGWTVHKRSGGKEKRNVVTTRKDGVVSVSFGANKDGGNFMKVTID